MPFYNGTTIWLDLFISIPREKHIDEDFKYQWQLITHEDKKIYQNGEGVIHLSSEFHTFQFWKNKRKPIEYSTNSNFHLFYKYYAIKIEPILDFDTYDLKLVTKNKEGVLLQFTLQDIDDYGKNIHVSWFTALITGFIGFILGLGLALLTYLILRGK